jgi:lipopolysaccharide transport system permease protein
MIDTNANQLTLAIEADRTERYYWQDLWRCRELFYFLAWPNISEKFVTTSAGRYLFDLYARLALAVAAHPQPEVLILGDVASVEEAIFPLIRYVAIVKSKKFSGRLQ